MALETYVATADGLARYLPDEHALQPLDDGDLRPRLQEATGGQPFVGSAPLVVIFSIVPGRVASRHGEERAIRYSDFEAGHAGQNLLLQAVALDLGAVPIGSFEICRVPAAGAARGEKPRYLFALGRRRRPGSCGFGQVDLRARAAAQARIWRRASSASMARSAST